MLIFFVDVLNLLCALKIAMEKDTLPNNTSNTQQILSLLPTLINVYMEPSQFTTLTLIDLNIHVIIIISI